MDISSSTTAYKRVIKTIYSCETSQHIDGARNLIDCYERLYADNPAMGFRTRVVAQERVTTAQVILKLKYRDLVD
tara:strand:+ start:11230 stop:11454 length:225 start_codon:yes stop_codon:yes gene_type:complete